jgi:hypothetical protein
MLSFIGKMLAGIAATLGLAAVARKYSEPPQKGASPASPHGEASLGAPPATAETAHAEHRPRPGWSRPKPEVIPEPTYWPAVFGLGIAFLMWGFISNIFVWGMGFILIAVALVGWIGDLRNEFRS